LLSLVITLTVVIGGFLLYALIWEGTPKLDSIVLDDKNNSSIESAQKLLVGNYLVYITLEPTPDGSSKVRIWRYLVGGAGAEEITSFLTVGKMPQFFKFSEESLAVWQEDNNKELWHINGDLIGPAENTQALISPDRRWLIGVNKDSAKPAVTLQSISTGAKKDWLISDYLPLGYLVPQLWSDDSRLVYLTAEEKFGNGLPGLWILDLNREEMVEFAEVAANNISDITVYPNLNKAIGAKDGLPSYIMLIDLDTGTTRELISNKDYELKSPKLSANGRNFSYTLLGSTSSVWLANFINPQDKQEELLIPGRLLAWPQDDIWLIAASDSLQIYNKSTRQTINLVTGNKENTSWEFIGIFNIK